MFNEFEIEEFMLDEEELGDPKKNSDLDDEEADDLDESELEDDDEEGEEKVKDPLADEEEI